MRILTRYVLSELTKVFLVSLTGMTIFMLMVGVVQEAVRQSLGLPQILMLLPYLVPEALRFAVPATILFATCSVFGRFASGNEIVAIKAQGISPMVIVWPVLIFATLVSFMAVWLNDVAVSWGRDGARRVVIQSVEQVAYSMLEQNHRYATKQFAINVRRVEGRKLIRPTITFQATEDEPGVTLVCEDAELRSDLQANTLTMVCHNGTIDVGDVRAVFHDTQEREIPLDQASKKGEGGIGPADLPLSVIPTERSAQLERNTLLEQQLAAQAALDMITGDLDALTDGTLAAMQGKLQAGRFRLYRLQMEPHRRWANGFSCLCFVVIGLPIAILRRNADFLSSFFVVFLPILLAYYPMLMYALSQAKSGNFPWLVWIGNVVLLICGYQFMKRVIRY